MLLYFHKDPLCNFGDDLNPWLWPKIFPGLFTGELYHDPKRRMQFSITDPLFIGIGTLLNTHVPQENSKIVFGSGVGYGVPPQLDERWEIICVRGPLTACKLGLPDDKAIVDPAILAPDYVQSRDFGSGYAKMESLAYMPHCGSARNADWVRLCHDAGIRYIDPQWPVEQVISAISCTSTLLTEALHGAILAEAFRIPWVPIRTSNTVLDFKWNDWCQSMGVDYRPQTLPALWPPKDLLGHMRGYLKEKMIVNHLKRLMKSHQSFAGKDRIFYDRKQRLIEKIETYRRARSM